jgi:uncharacterized membrane protein
MKEQRPKIKLKLSKIDIALEWFGWILLMCFWGFTALKYKSLPEIIPTHFNATGIADGFGEKWNIITLPGIASVLFIGLTVLNQFPHVFNYLTEITEVNAEKEYTKATKLIRNLKIMLVFIFFLIAYKTIKNSLNQSNEIEIWFTPLVILLIFIPLLSFALQYFKKS